MEKKRLQEIQLALKNTSKQNPICVDLYKEASLLFLRLGNKNSSRLCSLLASSILDSTRVVGTTVSRVVVGSTRVVGGSTGGTVGSTRVVGSTSTGQKQGHRVVGTVGSTSTGTNGTTRTGQKQERLESSKRNDREIMENQKACAMTLLPVEIILLITKYINMLDQLVLMKTCTTLRTMFIRHSLF
jgi:hypothetical protein